MNETSPGILILGGGVTGMAAALALKDQEFAVHLVEKQDRLGGNAAGWACMATDTCQNCGACLAQEMADQVRQSQTISVHLNTELTGLDRTEHGLAATLSSGTTLTAARAVMATGFSPFDPAQLPSYHVGEYEKVITTARLNRLMKEDRLAQVTGSAPKIAFLQCVGSRDRKKNRDYCSQVCCKISMRHAQKIRHLLPEADISLFYMDLQVLGKETRTMADNLAGDIRLVQGVPAEILEDRETGRLTMVTEDPATSSRQSAAFDLIVLSVGLVPAPETAALSSILGLSPNPWGFFNTTEATRTKEVIIAGCAKGPQNITASIQEGRMAAAEIIRDLKTPSRDKRIAVIGGGPQARAVAAATMGQGYSTCLFGKIDSPPPGVEALEEAKIMAIDGTAGRFSIFYQSGDTKDTLSCSAIIAAVPPEGRNRARETAGAVSLAAFTGFAPQERPDNSLILLDYYGPESKAGARAALLTAIETQAAGKNVDILMNKMLVHGPEGQQVYDRARSMGINFLRYESPSDLIIETGDKGLEISLKEATLPGMDLTLTPETLVVPDTPVPAAGFPELALSLRLGLDCEGFLQEGNVRHRPVQSPRRGIYFAGSGHDDIDGDDLKLETRTILADLEIQSVPGPGKAKERLSINTNICASCLTCYRVCPHNAIIINEKEQPQIIGEACFECHACLSNCPAGAISSQGQENDDLAAGAQKGRTLVFACERSAALAAANDLPPGIDLVAVPCACRVSTDMILKALVRGVDRVVVSGCHEGNCRSMDGTAIARRSVAQVSAFPGIDQGKVSFRSVAANEPAAFIKAVSRG
ncbi:MAG: FAD-dependent oxidoreductase [Desulfobacter sp.]|nr:MAG: FAD-dependent oxidoreductase [Desulfobacter sp.]